MTTPPLPWIGSRITAAISPTPPPGAASRLERRHRRSVARAPWRKRIGKGNELRGRRNADRFAVAGLAGEPDRADGAAEIAAGEGDDARPAGRRFFASSTAISFAIAPVTAGRKRSSPAGAMAGERLVELGPHPRGMRRRAMHQGLGLGADRRHHPRMAVADRRDREAAIEIEIALAVGILDVTALRLLPHERRRLGEASAARRPRGGGAAR